MSAAARSGRRVAVVGGGWAGMAAAVRAHELGHAVTVFEAARQLGGRARGVPLQLPDGRRITVDNGQHILIGAYTDSLRLMRSVGVDPEQTLLRMPLALRFVDGGGLSLPDWPAPLDAAWGMLRARGWSWRERLALLRRALAWQRAGFRCAPLATVADVCAGLPQRLLDEFIEPLCVSALNTPVAEASGTVFLRVLRDALTLQRGGSQLLLPRRDLGRLFPQAAGQWLQAQGAHVLTGQRVRQLAWQPGDDATGRWLLDGQAFDHVIWASAAPSAAQAMQGAAASAPAELATALSHWAARAAALQHRPISCVYAQAELPAPGKSLLPLPMLALRSSAQAPAQFVFERDQLAQQDAPTGVLVFVISDSEGERQALQDRVLAQARQQLGLQVQPLFTLTEKRATFACTPGLQRPPASIAPGLNACGDYVQGPYPATLEGAVRNGLQAAEAIAGSAGSG